MTLYTARERRSEKNLISILGNIENCPVSFSSRRLICAVLLQGFKDADRVIHKPNDGSPENLEWRLSNWRQRLRDRTDARRFFRQGYYLDYTRALGFDGEYVQGRLEKRFEWMR